MKWQYLCSSCGSAIAPGDTGWAKVHGPGKCGPSRRAMQDADPVLAQFAAGGFDAIAAGSVRAAFRGLRLRPSEYVDECIVDWETDAVLHARRADRMRQSCASKT